VWSKRLSELAAAFYAHERGLKVAVARPNNVYGPGDHFEAARSRVVPSLIRDVFSATDHIVLWGSGEQVRTFLYVEDLARGLLDLTERHATCDPVDFGGHEEVTIRQLAELVVRLAGRRLAVVCDRSKPSGPQRRTVDTAKAARVLGYEPEVTLETGLQWTIAAYDAIVRAGGLRGAATGLRQEGQRA
jgi:GDP-L-fucose synthase